MGDLSDARLDELMCQTSSPDTYRALVEFKHLRAARTASTERVRKVVREAISGHGSEQFEGVFIAHRDIDAIADRVASQLAFSAPLSTADRSILQRLRDNEARAGNSIGHLGEDVRRGCDAAVELLDRLMGGVK